MPQLGCHQATKGHTGPAEAVTAGSPVIEGSEPEGIASLWMPGEEGGGGGYKEAQVQDRSGKVETCLALAHTASPDGRLTGVPGRVRGAEGETHAGRPAARCPVSYCCRPSLLPHKAAGPRAGR